ncbi:hypothetical protein BD770DRAFT_392087 [Pilaira anomala]|nr:hypothetical protein BD770DRAFT_392087 [Pilaira anomala]
MRSFIFTTVLIASFMVSASYASPVHNKDKELAGSSINDTINDAKLKRHNSKSTSTGYIDTIDTKDEDKIVIDASGYVNYHHSHHS